MSGLIGKHGGDAPDHGAPNMDHFCLQILPWDAHPMCSRLQSHGISAPEPVGRYGALGQGPSIYVSDPEGNTGELKDPPRA